MTLQPASHVLAQNYGTTVNPMSVVEALDELVVNLRTRHRNSYESWPTDSEIDGIATGELVHRLARLFSLNEFYRDGWQASAAIAGVCQRVQMAHMGNKPRTSFVPAVAEVLELMEQTGCSQCACVAALGGID